MKKNYVKPDLEVVMLSPENMLAGGSIIEGGNKPAGPQMTNKKEGGSWGRELWGDKED